MTVIFHELAVIAEPVSEEDQVVHLLAGLPESYDMLVTALESGSETMPLLENLTERLLREDLKMRKKEQTIAGGSSWQRAQGKKHVSLL